jgi:hypothetical protein
MSNFKEFSRNGTQVTGDKVSIGGYYDEEKSQLRFSFSKCAKGDIYDKAYGRAKAIGRAKGATVLVSTIDIPEGGNIGKTFKAEADRILIDGDYKTINSKKIEAAIKASRKDLNK